LSVGFVCFCEIIVELKTLKQLTNIEEARSTMPHGYHGKILVVNLSTGHIQVDAHDEAWYRTYMGGTNFGLYYILKHVPPGADALGPDNVLTLMLSVLTGAPFSGQSRMTANAKSPLTGAIGDAQAGGFFPAEMKNAGFDGVVVLGKAAEAGLPVAQQWTGRAARRIAPVGAGFMGDRDAYP
jgi:hypothetical protein